MADITVRPTNGLTGALATVGGYAAASGGGDRFQAVEGGSYLIHVVNGDATPKTLTIDDPTAVTPVGATAFNPDAALVVTNGTSRIFNLDNASRFRDANGWVNLSWSATTSVTFMVYRVN